MATSGRGAKARVKAGGAKAAGAEASPRPRYAVPALEKALDIIELMAAQSTALTGTQIAAELRRSSGEIFRILHCLEQRRVIERRQPGERYSLTVRLLELALSHPPIDRLLTSAIPVMQDVAASVRQSCHLAVREGAYILIVAQVPSPASIGFSVRRGARFPLTGSVSGRVLMSFRQPSELALWLRSVAEAPKVPAATPALMAQLAEIRSCGYEMVASPVCPGVTDVAVPVFDESGDAVAALTVPYFAYRETHTALAGVPALLQQAARSVSDSLGGGKWGAASAG